MKIHLEMTEVDLKKLILNHFKSITSLILEEKDINIMVKSKQNYKSEWEIAAFKAVLEK